MTTDDRQKTTDDRRQKNDRRLRAERLQTSVACRRGRPQGAAPTREWVAAASARLLTRAVAAERRPRRRCYAFRLWLRRRFLFDHGSRSGCRRRFRCWGNATFA